MSPKLTLCFAESTRWFMLIIGLKIILAAFGYLFFKPVPKDLLSQVYICVGLHNM